MVEHTTENRSVGSSILPLATTVTPFDSQTSLVCPAARPGPFSHVAKGDLSGSPLVCPASSGVSELPFQPAASTAFGRRRHMVRGGLDLRPLGRQRLDVSKRCTVLVADPKAGELIRTALPHFDVADIGLMRQ